MNTQESIHLLEYFLSKLRKILLARTNLETVFSLYEEILNRNSVENEVDIDCIVTFFRLFCLGYKFQN